MTSADDGAPRASSAGPGGAPVPLLAAGVLVGLEAVLLVGLGVLELASLSISRATMGVTTALFFVGYGAALGFFAWLLTRLRSWTRAPVVLAQLLQLGVAWSFRGGWTTVVTVGLAGMAVLVLAGIFHPASLRAVAEADAQDAESGQAP